METLTHHAAAPPPPPLSLFFIFLLCVDVFGRLDLIPLLRELAGGSRALETRLNELSRQSLLAREMVEQEAVRWERCQSINRRDVDDEEEEEEGESEEVGQPEGAGPSAELVHDGGAEASAVSPPRVRREEFPLSAFLKGRPGSGGEVEGRNLGGADLPELVREELMHRFVTGELNVAGYALLSGLGSESEESRAPSPPPPPPPPAAFLLST